MSASNASSPGTARKPSSNPTASATTSTASRQETPAAAGTANGVSRTRATKTSAGSPLSARGSVRRPAGGAKAKEESQAEDEGARAETASLIEDLKIQLHQAETASEENEKQLAVAQSRLEEALSEQSKLEEGTHAHLTRIEELENENKTIARANKEMEGKYEKEQIALSKERQDAMTRETDMKNTIQRLKDSIAQRDAEKAAEGAIGVSQTTSFRRGRTSPDAGSPPAQALRDSSTSSNSKLLIQKDKVIENLRLELAEAQIRLVEVENAGDGRFQELEKLLLETRMTNAKLMEDNESYQYLLSEKTLTGELTSKGIFHASSPTGDKSQSRATSQDRGVSSLADELENASDDPASSETAEQVRKLEREITAQKEQNKALTLYINKIITRLLQNDAFETLFENGSLTGEDNPLSAAAKTSTDPAPPPPPPKMTVETESARPPTEADLQKENAPLPSLLQRAGSIFGRRAARPQSVTNAQAPPPGSALNNPTPEVYRPTTAEASLTTNKPLPNPNEDPNTAPTIPINRTTSTRTRSPPNRSHRRARTEWSAQIVNNMYRGPSEGAATSGSLSPPAFGPHPLERQSSYLGGSSPPTSQPPPLTLEDNTIDDDSSNVDETDSRVGELPRSRASRGSQGESSLVGGSGLDSASSPPRSIAASSLSDGRSVSGGSLRYSASVSGNKMRPLRLVQEKVEADEAAQAERKKANRSSFMDWFGRGTANWQTQAQAGQTQQQRPGSSEG